MKTGAHACLVVRVHSSGPQRPRPWPQVLFNYDNIHPDGNTGMRIMAELALHVIDSTLSGLEAQPLTDQEVAHVNGPLPEPM